MDDRPWFVLIYQTTDAAAQRLLAERLKSLGSNLVVQTDQSGSEHYVTIGSSEPNSAMTVHEMVMSIDYDAMLIDSHKGTSAPRPALESTTEE